MQKRLIWALASLCLLFTLVTGCGAAPAAQPTAPPAADSPAAASVPAAATAEPEPASASPKYIFLFIGDGMSHVQVNAAQVYLGSNTSGEVRAAKLNFTAFPVAGVATTYDATSFCPDSASTATSLSSGVKTHSGVVGMEADKTTKTRSITEMLKESGRKIGIVSSVTINHATPAAFYAHQASRNDYYDIALQMSANGFDYYAGGTIQSATGSDGSKESAFEILKRGGYTIVDSPEAIRALKKGDEKVYAVSPLLQDSGAMSYAVDNDPGAVSLAEFVGKGIELLDNEEGFFMMCESGKIDWACHANDAYTAIRELVEFEGAIQEAVDFAARHPDETLILVTGDHETGGLTIGYATTGYDTAFSILNRQKMSYVAFDSLIGGMKAQNAELSLQDVLPVIKEKFGLLTETDPEAADEANAAFVLNEYEYKKLSDAFAESQKAKDERASGVEAGLLYGSYDPLSVTLTHIVNNKAGIGWTSYAHTGTPVPIYAMGAGAEAFGGSYDNTDIFGKLAELTGAK
ncbi:MAG: alkaline phosphatase [Christensenellaceae bacterium]|jgi:alkaline phosphatase|nr:alkaline phosphatase [Christensenellaceae bacterium]